MGVQYINGTTFNLRKTRAQDDRHIYYALNGKCDFVSRGCALTFDSGGIYIAEGEFLCRGGNVNVTAQSTIDIPTVQTETKYSLVFEIDLSQTNTVSQFNQGAFKMISGGNNFPALTQEDLDVSGVIYQMLFADIVVGTNGVVSMTDMRPTADRILTFPVNGWVLNNSMYEQTVRCGGVNTDSIPKYDLYIDGTYTRAEILAMEDAFAYVSKLETANSSVKLTCATGCPTAQFSIVLRG